jgi:hypothetical protein
MTIGITGITITADLRLILLRHSRNRSMKEQQATS